MRHILLFAAGFGNMQKLTMMRSSSTLSVIIPPQSHKDIKEKNELSGA